MSYAIRAIMFFSATVLSLVASAKSTANLDKDGLALKGFDAVSYFQKDGPVPGSSKFQVVDEDGTFRFANEENKIKFLAEPKKYKPQFGGWCAYAVADSKSKVDIDPKSFLIQDGRLLVFYNGVWADTRKKWQTAKGKSAQTFLKEADANWITVKPQDP